MTSRRRDTNLKANALTAQYYNAGRYIWTDAGGRVYFTLAGIHHVCTTIPGRFRRTGGLGAQKRLLQRQEPSPGSVDARRDALLPGRLRSQLLPLRQHRPELSPSRPGTGDAPHYKDGVAFRIRVLNVSADEQKIYFANDDAELFSLFEFDVQTGATRRLCPSPTSTNAWRAHVFQPRGQR